MFEVIKNCPLFHGIEDSGLRSLLPCLNALQREYSKGEFIFTAGDSTLSIGVVLSGSVNILQEDYWGNRTILGHMDSGSLFGEAFSCAESESLPVSVEAAENTKIMLIDSRRIVFTCPSSCGFHSQLIQNMMKILAQKNILLTQKMEIITHRTTRGRLTSYLSAQAVKAGGSRFAIPFDRQQLADYLSVERSAMSAELSRMKSEGLLWTRKNEFELLT